MASLTKRQGLLGKRLAAHLLRRTTYNITTARIADFANKTAEQAVNELFTIPVLTEPKGPINYEDGSTYWLTDGPYTPPSNSGRARMSVLFWFYNELMNDVSIRHKMTIFYSGIYVSADDADWRIFDGYRTFQHFALGNLKELSRRMTLDDRMLRYLNNNVNNKWNPNENYAREFLELFTILKGEQVTEGNYTNYTEHDIQEAARVLTGFRDGIFTEKDSNGLAIGYANYNHHDYGNKQFSSTFGNKVIMGATSEADMYRELQEFVDMVFDKVETARAFVRRLYLFFVSDRLSPEVEQDIIEPLALQLWSDNYEVENILKTLLKSAHFYDEDDSDHTNEIIGGKIKSPLELYFSTITAFDADKMVGGINATPSNYEDYSYRLVDNVLAIMGFPRYATSVEGYPGFFKSPSFSKSWVDTSTLPMRYRMATSLMGGSTVHSIYQNMPFEVDIVEFVKNNFVHQEYDNQLLAQIVELTLPENVDGTRMNYFRNKLTGGISSFNWMFEWQNYIATNDDSSVRVVLEDLFEALIGSPEYQTF